MMQRLMAFVGFCAFFAGFVLSGQAKAHEFEASMRAFVQAGILEWAQSPAIISEVQAQNAAHRNLTHRQIMSLDRRWRREFFEPERPTVDAVLSSAASSFLLNQVDASGGVFAEIFVTDNRGLLVASSGMTSDYWQGDEPKFLKSFAQPPMTFHYGEIVYDESAQEFLGQVSFPLVDPITSQSIGVVTVGLAAGALWASE